MSLSLQMRRPNGRAGELPGRHKSSTVASGGEENPVHSAGPPEGTWKDRRRRLVRSGRWPTAPVTRLFLARGSDALFDADPSGRPTEQNLNPLSIGHGPRRTVRRGSCALKSERCCGLGESSEGRIEIHSGGADPDHGQLLRELPETRCRWVPYDATDSPRGGLALITWLPEQATIKQRLLYTAATHVLRAELPGIDLTTDAEDRTELVLRRPVHPHHLRIDGTQGAGTPGRPARVLDRLGYSTDGPGAGRKRLCRSFSHPCLR